MGCWSEGQSVTIKSGNRTSHRPVRPSLGGAMKIPSRTRRTPARSGDIGRLREAPRTPRASASLASRGGFHRAAASVRKTRKQLPGSHPTGCLPCPEPTCTTAHTRRTGEPSFGRVPRLDRLPRTPYAVPAREPSDFPPSRCEGDILAAHRVRRVSMHSCDENSSTA